VSCESGLDEGPAPFAAGSASRWFTAVIEGTASLLRFGGGGQLAELLVIGMHAALVG
jgi:hypothetical protein